MRLLLALVMILAFVGSTFADDNPPPAKLYLQIVRGANDTKAKQPAWKAIGPKLAKRLNRVAPWNYYWETTRQTLVPTEGELQSLEVCPGRELKISWVGPHQVELSMYRNGKLRRKSKVTVRSGMTIVGGDVTGDEAWFVVVRKDKPSVE